ncbi:MAG: class I SAM-dependent methyltransferase [Bacteroidales bacterium]|nr:class I SAM-dependent methyltransferase [Bacteroidales bacterium]MDD4575975.1 class I SAM-dependent methyltransferase [Bacteroidales bacterium]
MNENKVSVKQDYIKGGTQKDFYNESERESWDCPYCKSDSSIILDTDRGLSVVRCNKCELIYTNPRAKDSEHNYFGDVDVFENEARLIFKNQKPHHRDRNYIYELKKIKKIKPSGKMLDVGSNMGFFMRKAREFGYDVEGVEPSPSLAKLSREKWGLIIHNAFLESANLEEKSFDIITLIDVFEHVTNPKEMLDACNKLLKDDGIIVIKVPNGDYNHFKMKLGKITGMGYSMDIWDCYEHVVHYTPKTFNNMISSCNYKIQKFIIPLPIHTPIWADLVGHYYLHTSPFILDWKRITLRNIFYYIGKMERVFCKKIRFGPDLMFVIKKKHIV